MQRFCRHLSTQAVRLRAAKVEALTDEQRQKLRERLPAHLTAEKAAEPPKPIVDSNEAELDKIRARSLLAYTYNYDPPANVDEILKEVLETSDVSVDENGHFKSLKGKAKVLKALGERFRHYVLSAQLVYVDGMSALYEFYTTPVHNTTEYAALARDTKKPANLAVLENPVRFHPNDTNALHEGISPTPGEGGKVFGIRNQRIYRQYRPKLHWFDYDEQNFDHEDVAAGTPWDPSIANKMDRYADRKFTKNCFVRMK